MKLNNLFSNSLLSVALLATSDLYAEQIFRSANQIPAPSNNGSQYIPLPGSNVSQQQNTQIVQLPQTSLTNASMIAQKPIKLDQAGLKQQTVTIGNDDTHVVAVSASSMNRISTPFLNPIVLLNSGATSKVVGTDVYVIMQSDQPVGIFIREDDNLANNSPVASLTMVPKAIPQQNISVILDGNARGRLTSPNKKVSSDYVEFIGNTMAAIEKKQLPDGFSRSNVDGKVVARVGAVTLKPKAIYSGVELNAYVYTAKNVSGQYVELSEPSFWHQGVRAIAFADGKIKLPPNGTTEITILSDVGDGSESIYD
ncbi:hypothetical protein HLH17_16415 [Acinetobacter sp. ANC 5380]|uniref:TraK C-terminal domain-containing protein n=1 Tax=Acinetobacter terrae TaxID=2731247 RepID=A0A7Y2RI26_9GAMM|nr:type-F conjugative transfer system secretin TraK [Acinetobacter terrae]NNH79202.1 hypothetical protein [Acinetobacter terrae]